MSTDGTVQYPLRSSLSASEAFEDNFQQSLRPQKIKDYIGQSRLLDSVSLAIAAAKRRSEALDHVLLHGPPGLGKTTLAQIIANEMGVSFKATSGPVLERPGDLAAILSGLSDFDVLFIDEVHRLNRIIEEILYPAMEDFKIDIIIGQGPAARSVKLNLRPFTLVAATTRTGLLTAPLRDRFGIVERLEFYDADDLVRIVHRSAEILGVSIDEEGARQIALRSRGTPRIANRLLKRARDYAQERASGLINKEVAALALSLMDVDEKGFDQMDRSFLLTIIDKFDGGPVGIETLAAALQEDKDTLEDVYEPYLMQQGFLRRGPRGREATRLAYDYFSRTYSKSVEARNVMQQMDWCSDNGVD